MTLRHQILFVGWWLSQGYLVSTWVFASVKCTSAFLAFLILFSVGTFSGLIFRNFSGAFPFVIDLLWTWTFFWAFAVQWTFFLLAQLWAAISNIQAFLYRVRAKWCPKPSKIMLSATQRVSRQRFHEINVDHGHGKLKGSWVAKSTPYQPS